MTNENDNQGCKQPPFAAAPGSALALSDTDRRQIAEILGRRANEIAGFKSDLEEAVTKETGRPVRLYNLPGSVEMAMTREIGRLRRLEATVKPPPVETSDED